MRLQFSVQECMLLHKSMKATATHMTPMIYVSGNLLEPFGYIYVLTFCSSLGEFLTVLIVFEYVIHISVHDEITTLRCTYFHLSAYRHQRNTTKINLIRTISLNICVTMFFLSKPN